MVIVYVSDFATFGPTVIWRGKFSLRSQMSFLTVATFTCFSSSPSRPWILVRSWILILKLILVLSSFLIWILSRSMSHDYYSLFIKLLQRPSQHISPVGHFEQGQEFWKWKSCLQGQESESEKLACKIRKVKVKNLPARSEKWKWKTCLQDQEVPCTASFHTEIRISQSLKQKW